MSFWNRNIIRRNRGGRKSFLKQFPCAKTTFHSSMHSLSEPYIFYCVSYSIFATSFWPVLMIAFVLHFIRVYFLYWNCANYVLNCCIRCFFNFHWNLILPLSVFQLIWCTNVGNHLKLYLNNLKVFYGKKECSTKHWKKSSTYFLPVIRDVCIFSRSHEKYRFQRNLNIRWYLSRNLWLDYSRLLEKTQMSEFRHFFIFYFFRNMNISSFYCLISARNDLMKYFMSL